jgi:hypothetical protein
MVDLLPCPFCGSAPELIPFKRDNNTWLVRCTGPECQCKTVNYYGKSHPVFVWNKRIIPHVQREAGSGAVVGSPSAVDK